MLSRYDARRVMVGRMIGSDGRSVYEAVSRTGKFFDWLHGGDRGRLAYRQVQPKSLPYIRRLNFT